MIGGIRETRLVAPLAGCALMVAALLTVGACADISLGSAERTGDVARQAGAAPARTHATAASQERMPPAFEVAKPRPAPPMPREKPPLLLRVSAGETVQSIARRFGVTPRMVIALNDLTRPYLLLVGQQLMIPRAALSDGRRHEPPTDAHRLDRDTAHATTTEIAAPVHEVHVTEIETAAPPRDRGEALTATDAADPPAVHDEPIPEPPAPPGPRVARAEPAQSSPSSLSALVRRADATEVPLPPTRDTFLWPIEGRVISGFGSKPGGMHNDGINIAVPVGSDVRAAKNGIVAYAGNELRGYGNLVLIRHKGGWMTAYAHNDSLLVGKGDVVQRGQVISRSGKSGRVSRPQAHFEIRRNGEPQDPLRLLTRK